MSHCCPSSLPSSAHSASCQSLPIPQSPQSLSKVGSIMKLFKFLAKPRLATPLVELIAEEIKTSDEAFSREALDEVLDTLLNSDATLKQTITLYRLMSAKSVRVEAPSQAQAPAQVAPAQAPIQAPIQAPTQAATEPVDKSVGNAVANSVSSGATATPSQAASPNPKLLELLRAQQDIEYQIKALQSLQSAQ